MVPSTFVMSRIQFKKTKFDSEIQFCGKFFIEECVEFICDSGQTFLSTLYSIIVEGKKFVHNFENYHYCIIFSTHVY